MAKPDHSGRCPRKGPERDSSLTKALASVPEISLVATLEQGSLP
jgi:hypothetical protein